MAAPREVHGRTKTAGEVASSRPSVSRRGLLAGTAALAGAVAAETSPAVRLITSLFDEIDPAGPAPANEPPQEPTPIDSPDSNPASLSTAADVAFSLWDIRRWASRAVQAQLQGCDVPSGSPLLDHLKLPF